MMVRTRIITAFVLIGILLLAAFGGNISLSILAATALGCALFETYYISSGLSSRQCIALASLGMLPIVGYIIYGYPGLLFFSLLHVLILVHFLVWITESFRHQPDLKQLTSSLGLAQLYPLPFGLALTILAYQFEVKYSLLLMSVVAIADTSAFFVGRKVGGAKLAARISPNKTISGAIAGIIGASIGSYFFHIFFIFGSYAETSMLQIIASLMLGIILGVASIFGDLMESLFKRIYGVKDSGSILPGHGGVLDRIDGLLVTAPVMLIYLFLR